MKHILPLLLLFPLTGCPATGTALDEQAQAYKDLRVALEDPFVTQAELDAKLDALATKTTAVVEAAKEDAEGLTGDPLTDSALITGIGGALLWWLRQRTRDKALAELKA